MSSAPLPAPDYDSRGDFRLLNGQLFNPYDDGRDWVAYVASAPNQVERDRRMDQYRREAGWGLWWPALRQYCLHMANGTCSRAHCHETKGLQLHHTLAGYDHLGHERFGHDIVVICRAHHMQIPGHGYNRNIAA